MNFTYEELARLNSMIGAALMSGKIKFDEISESVHKKVSDEIYVQMQQKMNREKDEQSSNHGASWRGSKLFEGNGQTLRKTGDSTVEDMRGI